MKNDQDEVVLEDKVGSQSNFMVLLASLIGTILSFKWLLHEINVVMTLLEFDMEVSWFVYIPLILFILLLFIGSLILLIGSCSEFKTKVFLKNSNFKVILLTTLIFNMVIVLSVLINEYIFNGIEYQYAGIVILGFLISIYIYVSKKYELGIFYFITMSAILSALFWGTIYILF